jgi:hypothetical protein
MSKHDIAIGLLVIAGILGFWTLTAIALGNRRQRTEADNVRSYGREPDENWVRDLKTEMNEFPVLPEFQRRDTAPLPVFRDSEDSADWAETLLMDFRRQIAPLAHEMSNLRRELVYAPIPD